MHCIKRGAAIALLAATPLFATSFSGRVIGIADGDTIRIMHNGETMLFACGVYRDRIDISGTPYRFIERLVVTDSHKIDTLLAIPI